MEVLADAEYKSPEGMRGPSGLRFRALPADVELQALGEKHRCLPHVRFEAPLLGREAEVELMFDVTRRIYAHIEKNLVSL